MVKRVARRGGWAVEEDFEGNKKIRWQQRPRLEYATTLRRLGNESTARAPCTKKGKKAKKRGRGEGLACR